MGNGGGLVRITVLLTDAGSGTGCAESRYSWIVAEAAFIYGSVICRGGRGDTSSVGFIEDAARNGALWQIFPIVERGDCGDRRRWVVLSCSLISGRRSRNG